MDSDDLLILAVVGGLLALGYAVSGWAVVALLVIGTVVFRALSRRKA